MPDLTEPGTRVRPVPSVAARIGQAVRYAITGVAPDNWFGPLQPLKPMAPEGTGGRRFDYPVGYNLRYIPRDDEPISFVSLRGLAETCDILRLVIETRKDQIEAQSWDVRPRKRSDGFHPKASSFAAEIAAAKEFFAFPDREHDLASWLRSVAEEMFVTDAVSIYARPDRGGRIFAFEQIDGATIAPRIDAWGRTPLTPDVAYQQILHGVPAADFSTSELIYLPRNRRPGHVYGYSPVEQVIVTANILIRRNVYRLSYYTEGNLVDALLTVPINWTPDEIKDWQNQWDSQYAGNLQTRRRGVWVPGGVDFKPLKEPDLKDPFDEFLARIICFAFSISPQPFVSMMNRATAESAHDAAMEEGLLPVLNYFTRLFRILFDRMGWSDIEMVPIDDREGDPKTADDIDVADVKAGIRTINEVRASRGLDPVEGGDFPMLATAAGYVPLHGGEQLQTNAQGGIARRPRGTLGKDWDSDLHPRWPAGAQDSQGGQFAPKGEGSESTAPRGENEPRSGSQTVRAGVATRDWAPSPAPVDIRPSAIPPFDPSLRGSPEFASSGAEDLINAMGPDATAIATKSSTLTGSLRALQLLHWQVAASDAGSGSYTDRINRVIYIDDSDAADVLELIQTISHEVGHALYDYNPDETTKEAYVKSRLGDEGMATISNIRIEREIRDNGGPDIGIAGNPANANTYNAAYDQYLKDGSLEKARDTIGAIYGSGEHTSTTGQKYQDYYGDFYDKLHDSH